MTVLSEFMRKLIIMLIKGMGLFIIVGLIKALLIIIGVILIFFIVVRLVRKIF